MHFISSETTSISKGLKPIWSDEQELRHIESIDLMGGQRTVRIATVAPICSPLVNQIHQGFVQSLEQQSPIQYEHGFFSAKNNAARLSELLEHIILKEYDLILSIGSMCSAVAKKATAHKKRRIPVVFTAVHDPVGEGLVESVSFTANNLTGLATGESFHPRQASLLAHLMPKMRQVGVLYNPMNHARRLHANFGEIQKELDKAGIQTVACHVVSPESMIANLKPLIGTTDAFILLRDSSLLGHIDELVELCNEQSITLVSSDWYSVERGAAMGFGTSEYTSGSAAASKVRLLVEGNLRPDQIPVTVPEYQFKLRLNQNVFKEQGLQLDEKTLSLLRAVHIL